MEAETVVTAENASGPHGWLIDINAPAEHMMEWAAMQKTKHFAEVCVRYNGQQKEFELAEFLELLGFVKSKEVTDEHS